MAVLTNAVYSLVEFKQAASLSDESYFAAVRQGLVTIKHGKKKYVRGSDWEAFLASKNEGPRGYPVPRIHTSGREAS